MVELENRGGLVTPVPLKISYAGGGTEMLDIPAEIWRKNTKTVRKLIVAKKEVTAVEFDPRRETADADTHNNHWPPQPIKSRFQLKKEEDKKNPMQVARDERERAEKEKEKAAEEAKSKKDK